MSNQLETQPLFPEDCLEECLMKRADSKIIIVQDKNCEEEEVCEKEILQPSIISLDKITKYKSLFIAVHPFIQHGYRIHHNMVDCIGSIFKIHNETFNIWSHIIAFVTFVATAALVYTDRTYTTFASNWVVYLYLAAAINCFVSSSIYHTYNCHSHDVANFVFKIDLLGIVLVLLSGAIGTQHFMFHEFPDIRRGYIIFYIVLSTLIVLISNVSCCKQEKLNLLRIFLVILLFASAFLSSIHWALIADMKEVEAITPYYLMGYVAIYVGFVFYFSKFPECSFQHRIIDIYFQSHTIWHYCVYLAAISYYVTMYKYNEILEAKGFYAINTSKP